MLPIRLYTQYIHKYTLARGEKERATVSLSIARQYNGKNTPHATSKRLTHIFLLGFVVAVCCSEVELGDRPLTAAVGQLVGDALAVALQFGQVLVKHFA